jgi:hypothetical protein
MTDPLPRATESPTEPPTEPPTAPLPNDLSRVWLMHQIYPHYGIKLAAFLLRLHGHMDILDPAEVLEAALIIGAPCHKSHDFWNHMYTFATPMRRYQNLLGGGSNDDPFALRTAIQIATLTRKLLIIVKARTVTVCPSFDARTRKATRGTSTPTCTP